jgi:hypothetical protein
MTALVARPRGTSWGAVLGGWLATVGVAAILTPIIGLVLATWYPTRGYASTVPILVGVGLAYLIGGYLAGRIAGARTSWHGMLVAFFGLFVVLALLVIDIAFETGVFGSTARLVQVMPLVLGVAFYESVETFAFGGALGMLIAIFAAWLGGLLAPNHMTAAVETAPAAPATSVVQARRVTPSEANRPRQRYRLLPSMGRKGGERADALHEVERVERTDRVERT